MMPGRLSLARAVCRPLAPLIAPRVRSWIYPFRLARCERLEFTVHALTGSPFIGNTADLHGYPFAVHGYYYWRAWAAAAAVCGPGDTIIEVGANIGTETVGFADIVGPGGRVHAFEPLEANHAALKRTLEFARLRQVRVYPFAVGSVTGRVRFIGPRPGSSGTGYACFDRKRQPVGDGRPRTSVRCVRLDEMPDLDSRIRLLFIDAEGSEVDVLRGAGRLIAKHRPAILLEASRKLLARAGFPEGLLFREIRERGYRVFGIGRLGTHEIMNAREGRRFGNWVCLDAERAPSRNNAINRNLLLAGLLPCAPFINPIVQRPRRTG